MCNFALCSDSEVPGSEADVVLVLPGPRHCGDRKDAQVHLLRTVSILTPNLMVFVFSLWWTQSGVLYPRLVTGNKGSVIGKETPKKSVHVLFSQADTDCRVEAH